MKVQIKLPRIFGIKIDRDRVFADEINVRIDALDSAVRRITNQMPKLERDDQTAVQSALVRSL